MILALTTESEPTVAVEINADNSPDTLSPVIEDTKDTAPAASHTQGEAPTNIPNSDTDPNTSDLPKDSVETENSDVSKEQGTIS